jgi:hypothetical protein
MLSNWSAFGKRASPFSAGSRANVLTERNAVPAIGVLPRTGLSGVAEPAASSPSSRGSFSFATRTGLRPVRLTFDVKLQRGPARVRFARHAGYRD